MRTDCPPPLSSSRFFPGRETGDGGPCPPGPGLRSPGRRGPGSSPGRGREEQEQDKGNDMGQEQEEGGDWENGSTLCQLDGNTSVLSVEEAASDGGHSDIIVQLRHRPARTQQEQRTPVRSTVHRSNKLVEAISAPRITLYNVRSAWAKWDPTLKQIVRGVTNKNQDKTLDVIIMDCQNLYQKPSILPPMTVDSGKVGKDSDHNGVEALSRTNLAPEGSTMR